MGVPEQMGVKVDACAPPQPLDQAYRRPVPHRRADGAVPQVHEHVVAVQLAVLGEQVVRIEVEQRLPDGDLLRGVALAACTVGVVFPRSQRQRPPVRVDVLVPQAQRLPDPAARLEHQRHQQPVPQPLARVEDPLHLGVRQRRRSPLDLLQPGRPTRDLTFRDAGEEPAVVADRGRPAVRQLDSHADTAAREELVEHVDAVQRAVHRGWLPGRTIGVRRSQPPRLDGASQPPSELVDVLRGGSQQIDVEELEEDQPRLQVEGTGPEGVWRLLPVGTQSEVVVHRLDDPSLAVHDGVRLVAHPGPHDPSHVHPRPSPPIGSTDGATTATDSGHDGVSATGADAISGATCRTSLTPQDRIQIKAASYGGPSATLPPSGGRPPLGHSPRESVGPTNRSTRPSARHGGGARARWAQPGESFPGRA